MQINTSKTKEMILGRINPADIPLLSTPVGSVERVTNFKLLGVHLEASLSWAAHINHIVAKARSEERRVGKECRSRWSPYH